MTFDVEEHLPTPTSPYRVGKIVDRFCEFMAERNGRASTYVVGTFAEAHPDAVRQRAAAGHEIGLHNWVHEPIFKIPPERFAPEIDKGRKLLQDLSQQPVDGYRAPYLSLTPAAPWIPDALAHAGFTYSSSIYPGRAPFYGWPGTPAGAFRWASGLIELPCPLTATGPLRLPFLGSVYLRAMPLPIIRWFARRWPSEAGPLWTYSHPYDFDADEPFWRMEPSWVVSRLLWLNRKAMWKRMASLVGDAVGPTMAEHAAALADSDLPVFDPAPKGGERNPRDGHQEQ